MNASLTFWANGKRPILKGKIWSARPLVGGPDVLVALVSIDIHGSDSDINLHFDTADEVITFCTAHNIPYEDKRQAEDG